MHLQRKSKRNKSTSPYTYVIFALLVLACLVPAFSKAQQYSAEMDHMSAINASDISSSEIILSWTPPPPPENDNSDAVKISYFYKPNEDVPKLINNVDHFIYTKNDEEERDVLVDAGKDMVLQYLRFDSIHDPCHQADGPSGAKCSCNDDPNNNNVGWNSGDVCMIRDQHPDWFLRDYRGRVMHYENYVFMDPGHPGWQQFWLERVRYSQHELGWDGVFLDNMAYRFGRHHNNPIELEKYPDDESYVAAVTSFLKYTYEEFFEPEGRLLYSNIQAGYHGTPAFFSYLEYLDGVMDEFWGVDWTNTGYFSEKSFDVRVNRIETAMKMGKGAFLVSQGNKWDNKRQRFALATYLLIDQGKASFRYTDDHIYGEMWLYDNYDLPLGTPLGDRYRDGSGWRRDFTNGSVYVNPGQKTSNIEVYDNSSSGTKSTTAIEVERSTDGGQNFILVHTLSSGATSIIDDGLSANTEYCYRIRALYSDDTNSGWMTTSCTTTQSANQSPVINDIGNQVGQVGMPVALQITATDAETTDIVFQATNLPDGLEIDPMTGLITGEPTTAGASSVTIKVTDNHSASTTASFSWTINPVSDTGENNEASLAVTRLILVNADTDTDIGELTDGMIINLNTLSTSNLSVRAETQPTPVGSVTFGLNSNPNFNTENVAPYALKGDDSGDYKPWQPSLGTHTITATAFSGSNSSGEVSAVFARTFEVVNAETKPETNPETEPETEPNLPPQITSPGDQSTSEGTSVSLAIQASDPENTTLSYSATGLPAGLMIDFSTGVITGQPTEAGSSNVTVTVFEESGDNSASISFTWVVIAVVESTPTPDPEAPESPPPPPVDNAGAQILTLTLVNADNNNDLMAITNGATIYLNSLPTQNVNVRADVSSDVESVYFQFNNDLKHVENVAPYALKGDNNGNYKNWSLPIGQHTLIATGYSQKKAEGRSGQPFTVNFTVAQQSDSVVVIEETPTPPPPPPADNTDDNSNPPVVIDDGSDDNSSNDDSSNDNDGSNTDNGGTDNGDSTDNQSPPSNPQPSGIRVTRLVLVNAETNQDIMTLTNGAVINLNNLPTKKLNIRADTEGDIGSVRFTGSESRTENVAPYALKGDNNGNYDDWRPNSGSYTITATPYENQKAGGTAGTAVTVSFTVQG